MINQAMIEEFIKSRLLEHLQKDNWTIHHHEPLPRYRQKMTIEFIGTSKNRHPKPEINTIVQREKHFIRHMIDFFLGFYESTEKWETMCQSACTYIRDEMAKHRSEYEQNKRDEISFSIHFSRYEDVPEAVCCSVCIHVYDGNM
jgi:hypothetical protein